MSGPTLGFDAPDDLVVIPPPEHPFADEPGQHVTPPDEVFDTSVLVVDEVTGDVVDVPVFASGDMVAAPSDAAERLLVALREGPVLAGDFWDLEFEPVKPEMIEVGGGTALLYRNMSHVFIGEPGRGKSLIAQWAQVQLATAGVFTLFIDAEKDFKLFRDRLRMFGVTREVAGRMGYWRAQGALDERVLPRLLEFVRTYGVENVTVDSVGRFMSRGGFSENDNDDARNWYDRSVEPFLRTGTTVVLIDHYKKPDTGSGQARTTKAIADRYAKGAGAKLDVITGAAFGIEFSQPFSKNQEGFAKMVCCKDNNGEYFEGQLVAEVHVSPRDGGASIDIDVRAAQKPDVKGLWWPTTLMTKAAKHLEDADDWVSTRKLTDACGGKSNQAGKTPPIVEALQRLSDPDVGLVESREGAAPNSLEWRRTPVSAPTSFSDWEAGPPAGWREKAEAEAF